MTRPRDHAITLDQDLVLRFAAYLNRLDLEPHLEPRIKDWGVFYSSAGDRTWAPVAPWGPDAAPHWTPLERELATLYDQLTPSQRRRLCQRAEAMTVIEVKSDDPDRFIESMAGQLIG